MGARGGAFDGLMIAAGLLTRLPLGAPSAADGAIAAAGWAFPLVGAGIGTLAAIAFVIAESLGLSALPAALLTVAAGIALTGALHEDGLADTADGLGGGRSRADKLAIMRDSRHGTFGILALVLSVALRAAALAQIGDPLHAGLALIAAHAAARGTLPPIMRLFSPARADGLAATAGRPSLPVAMAAAAIGVMIALTMLGPWAGAVALILTAGATALAALLAWQQIGGYTGDILGCCQQLGEIIMLLAAAAT